MDEAPQGIRGADEHPLTNGDTLAVPAVRGWGWGLAARWTIIYTFSRALAVLPLQPLGISPYRLTEPLWNGALPLFASLFGVDPGLYGDGMARVRMLYNVLFALVVGLVWLLLDRRRKHEVFIFESARLMARYTLAAMLLYYGGEKFIGDQGGQAHQPERLLPPFGEISGWSAMMAWLSHSIIYAWFAGWAEAGAGILMFSRRFTTLAAWLALADMGMVWLINHSYWDSWGSAAFAPLHFVPPAVFLVAPHLKRTLDFFVLNRPAAMPFVRLDVPAWFRRPALALKIVVVPWVIYSELIGSVWHGVAVRTETPLQGLYRVEHFERNGVVEPIAYEFPDRWRDVAFSPPWESTILVRRVNDENIRFSIDWPAGGEEEREDYTLRGRARSAARHAEYMAPVVGDIPLGMRNVYRWGESWQGSSEKGEFGSLHYTRTLPGEVTLEGTVAGDTLKMRLRRIVIDELPYFEFRWKPI